MRTGHQSAEQAQIVCFESLGSLEDAQIFTEDMPTTLANQLWQFTSKLMEVFHGYVAKRLHTGHALGEIACRRLAFCPPLVVFAGGQLMPNLGVANYQPNVRRDRQ